MGSPGGSEGIEDREPQDDTEGWSPGPGRYTVVVDENGYRQWAEASPPVGGAAHGFDEAMAAARDRARAAHHARTPPRGSHWATWDVAWDACETAAGLLAARPTVGGELSIEDCDKAVEALGVIRSRLDTNATDAVSRFVWKAQATLFGSGGAGDLATPETLRGGEFLSGLAEQGFRELAEGDANPGEPAAPPIDGGGERARKSQLIALCARLVRIFPADHEPDHLIPREPVMRVAMELKTFADALAGEPATPPTECVEVGTDLGPLHDLDDGDYGAFESDLGEDPPRHTTQALDAREHTEGQGLEAAIDALFPTEPLEESWPRCEACGEHTTRTQFEDETAAPVYVCEKCGATEPDPAPVEDRSEPPECYGVQHRPDGLWDVVALVQPRVTRAGAISSAKAHRDAVLASAPNVAHEREDAAAEAAYKTRAFFAELAGLGHRHVELGDWIKAQVASAPKGPGYSEVYDQAMRDMMVALRVAGVPGVPEPRDNVAPVELVHHYIAPLLSAPKGVPDVALACGCVQGNRWTLVDHCGGHGYQPDEPARLAIHPPSGASAREPRGLHVMADDGSVLVDLDVGAREPQWTKDALFAAQRRVVELDAELAAIRAEPTPLPEPRVSFCWGLREGQWWLVKYENGEPLSAFHQQHGEIVAHRDTFARWTKSASQAPPVSHTNGARLLEWLDERAGGMAIEVALAVDQGDDDHAGWYGGRAAAFREVADHVRAILSRTTGDE